MLSFEKFNQYLQEIIECDKWANSVYELFKGSDAMFEKTALNTAISLLADAMGDDDDWIVYWLYDTDYGKSWDENTAQDEDGNPILCRTPRELYDFLVKYNEEKATKFLEAYTNELQETMKTYCEVGSCESGDTDK